jgi:hypothetical protein
MAPPPSSGEYLDRDARVKQAAWRQRQDRLMASLINIHDPTPGLPPPPGEKVILHARDWMDNPAETNPELKRRHNFDEMMKSMASPQPSGFSGISGPPMQHPSLATWTQGSRVELADMSAPAVLNGIVPVEGRPSVLLEQGEAVHAHREAPEEAAGAEAGAEAAWRALRGATRRRPAKWFIKGASGDAEHHIRQQDWWKKLQKQQHEVRHNGIDAKKLLNSMYGTGATAVFNRKSDGTFDVMNPSLFGA